MKTFISSHVEVYLFVNYNHRLAKDIRVWQKSVKPFCEKSIVHMYEIYSKEYCIFYCYL